MVDYSKWDNFDSSDDEAPQKVDVPDLAAASDDNENVAMAKHVAAMVIDEIREMGLGDPDGKVDVKRVGDYFDLFGYVSYGGPHLMMLRAGFRSDANTPFPAKEWTGPAAAALMQLLSHGVKLKRGEIVAALAWAQSVDGRPLLDS
mmetsp:Transcript_7657/g.22699  ORF Transcript_7657/g.22699 Transcript_7657/m.22699 type:complete len:146 (-) Transcript_7657:516-953(-)